MNWFPASLANREMQNRTSMRYCYTLTKRAKRYKLTKSNKVLKRIWNNWNIHMLLMGMPNCTATLESSFFKLMYFNWQLFTLQYCGGFCHTSTWVSHGCTCVPSIPLPSPPHPSGLSQNTGFQCPLSRIKLGQVIYCTYRHIHVSMLFSQIIPPSPSPTESKTLFFLSVSLLLPRIEGRHYHLSKFHIYVLIYCIDVFLSDLLHTI